jgi:hypothetical protein
VVSQVRDAEKPQSHAVAVPWTTLGKGTADSASRATITSGEVETIALSSSPRKSDSSEFQGSDLSAMDGSSVKPTTQPGRSATPFIEVGGPPGMRAWSNGVTMIYIKEGRLMAAMAVGPNGLSGAPPNGTPLYRANGTVAGWIGPDSARPADSRPIIVPAEFLRTLADQQAAAELKTAQAGPNPRRSSSKSKSSSASKAGHPKVYTSQPQNTASAPSVATASPSGSSSPYMASLSR